MSDDYDDNDECEKRPAIATVGVISAEQMQRLLDRMYELFDRMDSSLNDGKEEREAIKNFRNGQIQISSSVLDMIKKLQQRVDWLELELELESQQRQQKRKKLKKNSLVKLHAKPKRV